MPQPPRNKTGRKYGVLYARILALAQRKGTFCITELGRWFSPRQYGNACRALAATGRLKRLRPSEIGRNRPRAIYQRI